VVTGQNCIGQIDKFQKRGYMIETIVFSYYILCFFMCLYIRNIYKPDSQKHCVWISSHVCIVEWWLRNLLGLQQQWSTRYRWYDPNAQPINRSYGTTKWCEINSIFLGKELNFVIDCLTAQFITAGDVHSCSVSSDGSVACWGSNLNGQIGTENRTDATIPQRVDLGNDPNRILHFFLLRTFMMVERTFMIVDGLALHAIRTNILAIFGRF
jgi:hypothetical protein